MPSVPYPRRITKPNPRCRGFSLIESLVALLLVTVALFLTLRLTTAQPRAMERMRVNESALRAVEAVLETIRSGTVPMSEGRTRWQGPTDLPPDSTTAGIQVTVDVTPVPGVRDLYDVTVEARYVVARRIQARRLQTMVWRPM
ncbi:MAG: type II secretion system protein [Acidobacteriota bacterium]